MANTKRVRIDTFPGSHKLDREGDRYIISDYSASTPEHTDDGILWVDPTRPIVMTSDWETYRTVIHIPVIKERTGEKLSCGEIPAGAFDLAHRLGMEILVKNENEPTPARIYRAVLSGHLYDTKAEEKEDAQAVAFNL